MNNHPHEIGPSNKRITGTGLLGGPLLLLITLLLLWGISIARSDELYSAPDVADYFNKLRMPDMDVSCCGYGDAYYADKVDTCGPQDGSQDICALVAIITDTRSNKFTLSNGTVIIREPVPVGTRVTIPPRKLRKPASANPTDHNIVFLRSNEYGLLVLCWEPVAGL